MLGCRAIALPSTEQIVCISFILWKTDCYSVISLVNPSPSCPHSSLSLPVVYILHYASPCVLLSSITISLWSASLTLHFLVVCIPHYPSPCGPHPSISVSLSTFFTIHLLVFVHPSLSIYLFSASLTIHLLVLCILHRLLLIHLLVACIAHNITMLC